MFSDVKIQQGSVSKECQFFKFKIKVLENNKIYLYGIGTHFPQPHIDREPPQVDQIFYNILSRALKYRTTQPSLKHHYYHAGHCKQIISEIMQFLCPAHLFIGVFCMLFMEG